MEIESARVSMSRIDRKSSIESEPRTLGFDQIQFAREAAQYVMNTKSIEEAMNIFTQGLKPVNNVCWNDKKEDDAMLIEDVTLIEEYEIVHNEQNQISELEGVRDAVSAPF